MTSPGSLSDDYAFDSTGPGRAGNESGAVYLTESERALLAGAFERIGPLRLVVIHGEPLGSVLATADEDEAVVGRDDKATVSILHGSISRRHAVLHRDGGGWFVEDCGSTNGTYVNGARVTTRCPLRQGDIVAFGAVVTKVHIPERPGVDIGSGGAHVDPVTGAFTPEYLSQRLDAEVAESYRRRRPISVAHVELDDFRTLAGRHGRETGDAALRAAADLVREGLRQSDILARHGDEGFIAILAEVTLPIAVRIGRRLLKAFRSQPLLFGTEDVSLTASIGVASTAGRWMSARDLVDAGRSAMERARRRGGDHVCA